MLGFQAISTEIIAGSGGRTPVTTALSCLVTTTPTPRLVRQTSKTGLTTTTPVPAMSRVLSIFRTFVVTTTPVPSRSKVLARAIQAFVTPAALLYVRIVQILRGNFTTSARLGGDSAQTRTTLGGGPDRTTLGGDGR